MNRREFSELVASGIVMLDGATGTELAKCGMPSGVCPEHWVQEHPEALRLVQSKYAAAGSKIVYTPTFGGNGVKLSNFGLAGEVIAINRNLAKLSRESAHGCFVFGDMAPTGKFVVPSGDMPFDMAVDIYREQARGLLEGGVDGFVIETMMDLQESRAAVIAVRELCDLPIMVTMTYESGLRTLTGNDPISALLALQALDIDAFGCNCSCGPEAMLAIVASMKPWSKVPLVAKPNAGLPHLEDDKTVFSMDAKEFASYAPQLVEVGVNLLGGCCGTTPKHIERAAKNVAGLSPKMPNRRCFGVSGPRKTCPTWPAVGLQIIGERINPTGKKSLQTDLRAGKLDVVWKFAEEQEKTGAAVLDVNCGMPGIDEKSTMLSAVRMLAGNFSSPLCIDTTSCDVAEAALREYPGRAIFNSISAESNRINQVLPRVAKYGPMLILLPVTDDGVPSTAEARIRVIKYIFEEVSRYGYTKNDVIVDVLAMTVAADENAARVALQVIDWCHTEFGVQTICGLSNISHGMPRRDLLNLAFLGMAAGHGLDFAIANPMQENVMAMSLAGKALLHGQNGLNEYIRTFADSKESVIPMEQSDAPNWAANIANALMHGNAEGIVHVIQNALSTGGMSETEIIDDVLLPSIAKVGELFEQKKYFLPQLVASANALKRAMDYLQEKLKKNDGSVFPKQEKVILATVKGDIHDIGKNITAMMLNNYGFHAVDLGKDVAAEEILDAAIREHAKIIGLSALMTTTMGQMKVVIDLAKSRGLVDGESGLRFIVGGAVVDRDFADSIGASYAADAMETVRLVQNMSTEKH